MEKIVAREIESWREEASELRNYPYGRSFLLRLIRAALPVLAVFVVVLLGSAFLITRAYSDRIYPQVVVGNIAVGSLTQDDAKEKLESSLEDYLNNPVVLTFGQLQWHPAAEDIGLTIDVEATVNRAMRAGREDPVILVIARTLVGQQSPEVVPIVMRIDESRLSSYLSDIGRQINRDPLNPSIQVSEGNIQIEGGGAGYTFLQPETESKVLTSLRKMSKGPVSIAVYTTAGTISSQEVSKAESLAKSMISSPITLVGDNQQKWQITTDKLQDWLRSKPVKVKGNTELDVYLDPVELENYLDSVAKDINSEPVNARLRWDNGHLSVLAPGKLGRRLDIDRAIGLIQEAAKSNSRQVQLPISRISPSVSENNIASLGIKELIASGVSGFRGSRPERIDNIKKAAQAINGYVIPAGSDFSFADAIGKISESAGYKPELVGDNRLELQGWPGGINQVATTVFRAALYAGLPILERHSMPYRLDFYQQENQQPGTDAMVLVPGTDLRFTNSTPAAILIQVSVSDQDQTVQVNLYGTDPGWSVDVKPPIIENVVQPIGDIYWTDPTLESGKTETYLYASAGADVVIERTVRKGTEVILDDNITSSYDPLPTVFAVGSANSDNG